MRLKFSVLRKILPLIHHNALNKWQVPVSSLDKQDWQVLTWLPRAVGRVNEAFGSRGQRTYCVTHWCHFPDGNKHHSRTRLARLDLTPEWKRSFWIKHTGHRGAAGGGGTQKGGGLAPKPAIGSSTIMVIFLGPPACRHTGAEENPERGKENRESEKECSFI